jgi:catechol 2,3-dioxygenase-like lactoylglutathione lyase family enzyme
MKLHRIDHVGINVTDLAAAKAFFLNLGMEVEGEGAVQGDLVDRANALEGVHASIVFMRVPDGEAKIELVQFHNPLDPQGIQKPQTYELGMRHLTFAVEDIDSLVAKLKIKGVEFFSEVLNYEGVYKLCFCRGPEGIIVELAEKIG